MAVYDPTVGSGGMLIQSSGYVEEVGGDSRNLALSGQEDNGGTWAICKMNMLLHGINSLRHPQGRHAQGPAAPRPNGELRRFDRVIANPPFSQNYTQKEMKFADRFHVFMPETGKKADLMFVQHMVAVLKSDGKHGLRHAARRPLPGRRREGSAGKWFIERRLARSRHRVCPPACSTAPASRPASWSSTRTGPASGKDVLFINADREFTEGKNQNSLRPEDIEKISHVYRHRLTVEKYSRPVHSRGTGAGGLQPQHPALRR